MKLAPSILSADFANLERDIRLVEELGADYIHVDVMDGQFVPNITLGPNIVSAIRPVTKLPLDVHLMIVQPENYINAFAEAGADIITVHQETTPHIHRALQMIKNAGVKAGVTINPGTPLSMIENVLDLADQVLVMTVNPGFGGQSFIENSLEKIAQLKEWRKKQKDTPMKLKSMAGLFLKLPHVVKKPVRKCLLQAPTFIMLKILKNESMH